MALAKLTIQQKGQPDRLVRLKPLRGEGRYGLAVSTAKGPSYRQSFSIDRVSDPEVLRKLSIGVLRQATDFSLAVNGKPYTVSTRPIAETGRIQLRIGDDILVDVDPDDSAGAYTAAMVGPALVAIIVVVIVIVVTYYVIQVVTESGNCDLEGESGDRDEGGDNDGGGDTEGKGDG